MHIPCMGTVAIRSREMDTSKENDMNQEKKKLIYYKAKRKRQGRT